MENLTQELDNLIRELDELNIALRDLNEAGEKLLRNAKNLADEMTRL